MKKLMIALAVTAMAVGVQAASIDWTAAGKVINHADGKTAYQGATYYVINTSAAGFDQAKLIAALTDGSMNATELAKQSYFVESYKSTSTKSAGSIESHTATADTLKDQVPVELAYILFDTYEGDDYFYLSSGASGKAYVPDVSEGTKVSFTATHYSGSPTGWTAVAVPEPTSGLLLLLGVAGLALRRRRA